LRVRIWRAEIPVSQRRSGIIRRGCTTVSTLNRQAVHETHSAVVRDDGLEHLRIEKNIKLAGSHRCQLTEHNIFGDTTTVIKFAHGRSLEKNLNSLFEGTSHQSTSIGTIDTVTGDSHQMTTRSHNINQESKMSMINVRTVEGQHL
jgi:hypothetical protein